MMGYIRECCTAWHTAWLVWRDMLRAEAKQAGRARLHPHACPPHRLQPLHEVYIGMADGMPSTWP